MDNEQKIYQVALACLLVMLIALIALVVSVCIAICKGDCHWTILL